MRPTPLEHRFVTTGSTLAGFWLVEDQDSATEVSVPIEFASTASEAARLGAWCLMNKAEAFIDGFQMGGGTYA